MNAAATLARARPGPRRLDAWARWLVGVYAVATILAFTGWLAVRWTPARPSLIELTFSVANIPMAHNLVSIIVLLLVTRALVARKRVGLLAVAFFQLAGIAFDCGALVRHALAPPQWVSHRLMPPVLDGVSLALGLVILGVLWTLRRHFAARVQRGSLLAASLVAVGGATLTIGLTTVALWLRGLLTAGRLTTVVAAALGDHSERQRIELLDVPGWLPELVSVLAATVIVTAVWTFLRSAHPLDVWTLDREAQLRRLLARFGQLDSLSYFATRRDKSLCFSDDRAAAVAFRVVNGVSLASGDPVGDPKRWDAALRGWLQEARTYGWVPAALGASEHGARAFVRLGFSVLTLGDEAVLTTDRFRLDTARMTPVRRAAAAGRRAGVRVEVRRQRDIPAGELRELAQQAHSWLDGKPARGYSMALGREADPTDGDVVVVSARNAEAFVGLLTFVPWGASGLSLDVMRRSPGAPHGVNELMVSELMTAADELGVRRVSLNFCMFSGVFADADRLGAGVITRVNSSFLGYLDRFWQLERLYRVNRRYQPQWVPRFVCFDSAVVLPQVALSCAIAEGFVRLPSVHGVTVPVLDEAARRTLRTADERPSPRPPSPRRDDQTRQRLAKLRAAADAGRAPYPVGLAAPSTALGDLGPETWRTPAPVTVSGRVRHVRDHGAVIFADLDDGSGQVQLIVERGQLPDAERVAFRALVDLGDLLRVDTVPTHSRSGTPSLAVQAWTFAAKALHPVPWRGLVDPQARLRNRSADLLVHSEQRTFLQTRAAVVASLRSTLAAEGFLEVETPVLHTVHGGASARPFRTHSIAYDTDLTLRIAPELFLKRLLVGGMGPLYEMGRNFRNEGVDATHNPEFTSLEAYQPFADYTSMRALTERLVRAAAIAVFGSPVLPLRTSAGLTLTDMSAPWPARPVLKAVAEAVHSPIGLATPMDDLLDIATTHGVHVRPAMGAGGVIEALYSVLVEPVTMAPTFFVDFPRETSPLTAAHRRDPRLAERWDLVVNGVELGTAYSELTDPVDQRARLTEQSLQASAGDHDAMEVDEDFLAALELGMPPTGGLGLGVDRLVMVLCDTPIRSVLSFPFVRQVAGTGAARTSGTTPTSMELRQ